MLGRGCILYLVAVLGALVAAAPTTDKRGASFNWGTDKVRGVNIGGWLVLEPYITPSFFQPLDPAIVDEYTLGQVLGPERALSILRKHWDTWVTWHDFHRLQQAGINVVRIPIGFWSYNTFGTPFVPGAAPYMDAAIDWARSLGLKVIIDLHGAPGSQNGFDNSGQRGVPTWTSGDTVQKTLEVLKTITDKYAQPKYQDVVIAIQFLNEPNLANANINADAVRQFYRDAFAHTRKVSDTPVLLSDGFLDPKAWNGFLSPSDNNAHGVIIDHHNYNVFDIGTVRLLPWQHRQLVCNTVPTYTGTDKWLIVGEWSAAMTDCALWLNGRGTGSRYDGTFPNAPYVGSCEGKSRIADWPQWYRDDVRGFIEAQLQSYESQTQGWIFWNFKTEAAGEWDFLGLVDSGIFPQPLGARKFGRICTNFG